MENGGLRMEDLSKFDKFDRRIAKFMAIGSNRLEKFDEFDKFVIVKNSKEVVNVQSITLVF